ncbi:MAG: hypothetical protein MUE86_02010 [Thiobacillaceae bacterium]|jgi:hypothetical protein|nr:hypothetical protein [Thiobacillaceae bacterium]
METRLLQPFEILPGRYYSNGIYGRPWGVRQVEAITRDADSGEESVDFKGIAGTCRRKRGRCDLAEFRRWARYEVALNENSWQRVAEALEPPAEHDAGPAPE